ncbi:MAG: S-layer homology domain-containing protein [Clostridia bacterium]|nr:S-layer homology domain-containing protein [Clostridia bacterium]
MMKKTFSVLLAVMMLFQLGSTAFAASYTDNVDVTANLQVTSAGTPMAESTPNEASVSKTDSEAFPAFDFRCVLNMDPVRAKFNDYYNNWISILNYAGPSDRIDALNAQLQAMQVTGSFTAEIIYPNTVTIPAEFLVDNQMVGFDDNAKLIFGNDTRSVTNGINTKTLSITFSIVGTEAAGRPGYVVANDLFANINTYLSNFTLTLPNVGTTTYGTHIVQGKLTGTTVATGDTTTLTITYQTNPEYATAIATVTEQGNRPIPTSSPIPTSTPAPEEIKYAVNFFVDGETADCNSVIKAAGATVSLSDLPIPYQDGYSFNGWYTEKELVNKVTADFTLTKNVNLYGKFVRNQSASNLNDTDHFAYIIGYPEGNVRPESPITREEVATIFFRLLKDNMRNELLAKTNGFTDIDDDRWSNTAISTLINGGFLTGYEDGTFRPDAPITRAEFATIASRLDTMITDATHNFTDVSGHWAEAYIANAVAKGWITGYEDGTFCPDQIITRAEAVTIVNRMLNRFLHHEGAHEDAATWPDNPQDAWYHLAIVEATNGHDYDRSEGSVYENWPSMREDIDWKALEQ